MGNKRIETRREKLDKIDDQIVEMFKQRMTIVQEIGQEKAKTNASVLDTERERSIIDRVTSAVSEELSEHTKELFKTIMGASRAYQEKIISKMQAEGKKFCLIGEKLGHSYSPLIHAEFGYNYTLVDLKRDELENFCKAREYDGFNVTIPYKVDIMQYLDSIDETALKVGCVNTVVNRGGKLIGYNTDIFGITYLGYNAGIRLNGKKVLILGDGGTAKTARALCNNEGAREIVTIDQGAENNYENISRHYADTQVIINTTPVGMYPDNGGWLVGIAPFKSLEGVIDVIYNPLSTNLLFQAAEKEIKTASGLRMLVAQAKGARDLFLGNKVCDSVIEKIYNMLCKDITNIVLIGMPSCGKSTVGKALAEKLGRQFVDTDAEVVKETGMSIPQIFEEHGEAYFRKHEQAVIEKYGKEKGLVISCGGGAVVNPLAYPALKQNGVIVHIERDMDKAETEGRPLLQDPAALQKLHTQRMPIYRKFADITIDNNGDINDTVQYMMEKLNEHFGD